MVISRNDPCWCGSGKKWKKCHFPEKHSSTADDYLKKYGIFIKSPNEIEKIRKSCKLAATILDELCNAAVEGVTTQELNDLAEKRIKQARAVAAPLHYGSPPFPKSICTSLNNVVCHGIPDQTTLKKGDILNIDITTILDGYYGDCSRMVCIDEISEKKQLVVDVSYEALMKAVEICKPGTLLCEIGNTIHQYADEKGCSVVYQFVGHGVGVGFHEPPQVFHNRNRTKIPLAPGMTFTIEPMINAGKAEAEIDPKDQWTARTMDGEPSGQWEHTILITEKGHEILTEI